MSKEVKISVIKFEMVNGKKTYKSFTFKLNPKEMAKFKTEATVKKKVAEYVAKSGVYKPSELQNLKYDMKEFLEEWQKMVPVVEAEELAKLDKSPNNPETRVTPHLISRLAAGEIFVFGSNAMGYHDGGAAKTAMEKFGAIRGQGHGLQGMSYAIDSMSGMEDMKKDVDEFIEFAKNHPDKTFFVTLIGCGIAGYSQKRWLLCLKDVTILRMCAFLLSSGTSSDGLRFSSHTMISYVSWMLRSLPIPRL